MSKALKHDDAARTCATCEHIGREFWGKSYDAGGMMHRCHKEPERRAAAIKPTGHWETDFERNWRTFFDVQAGRVACRHYEERVPLGGDEARLVREIASNGGKHAYKFFSDENRICSSLNRRFVEEDQYNRASRPGDGMKYWRLTRVGEAEADRLESDHD